MIQLFTGVHHTFFLALFPIASIVIMLWIIYLGLVMRRKSAQE